MTEWVISGTQDRVWLCPARGANPLSREYSRIELVQMEDHRLMFRVD